MSCLASSVVLCRLGHALWRCGVEVDAKSILDEIELEVEIW